MAEMVTKKNGGVGKEKNGGVDKENKMAELVKKTKWRSW